MVQQREEYTPMSREEFLEVLNTQLEGEIPSNEISQHLTYYNNFIYQRVQQGKPESDVINELGDPRLIAKTLIDTEDVPNIPGYQQSYDYSAEEAGSESFTQYDSPEQNFQQEAPRSSVHRLDLTTWRGKLALAAAALAIIAILLLLLGALLPIAAIAAVIGIITFLLRRL